MYQILGPLNDWEREQPYAKYYHRPSVPPDPHRIALLDKGPMDPAKATPLSDINSLLTRLEAPDDEIGYCVLPDGVGYERLLPQLHRGDVQVVVCLASSEQPTLSDLVPPVPRRDRRQRLRPG